jgi:hypothetical protein
MTIQDIGDKVLSCPDCGSDDVIFNPTDFSDYICRACGLWFSDDVLNFKEEGDIKEI